MTLKEVIKIHEILINEFGGTHGIRDMGLLTSAIMRPLATYAGADLYTTPAEKAAALFESIVTNHPFLDGNKRVGYVLLRLTLLNAQQDINASENERYEFVISVAEGQRNKDTIVEWIMKHLIEL